VCGRTGSCGTVAERRPGMIGVRGAKRGLAVESRDHRPHVMYKHRCTRCGAEGLSGEQITHGSCSGADGKVVSGGDAGQ
jgi:hypothetical protein